MKPIIRLLGAPLRRISLQRGNQFALWLLLILIGFAAGWISAVEMMRSFCFPAV